MKNLEQIRAAKALTVANDTTKADVNKLPAMIIANGLLATIAFANEKNERGQPKRRAMQAVMKGVAEHLASTDIGIAPGATDPDSLVRLLTNRNDPSANSTRLQRATAEALLLIGYVKRFATKEKGDSEQ
jgi:CRISPR-associated protein Cmr5